MRKAVWDSMLDADMNVRYWSHLGSRYYTRDLYSKIFLAVMSSGTVASWGFWSEFPIIWKIFSAASALLAIALPLLDWPKQISSMAGLNQKWTEIKMEYELLWLRLEKGQSGDNTEKEYALIREKEARLSQGGFNLPSDRKLVSICYDEVLEGRGLKKRGDAHDKG
ncbi:MAG: hypothetical protein ACLQBD_30160 [Syntrophobacteraceae bacterium]